LEISNERLIAPFKRGSNITSTIKQTTILLTTLKKFHSPKNSNKIAIVKKTKRTSFWELDKILETELSEL
jgi:hypothetical protein